MNTTLEDKRALDTGHDFDPNSFQAEFVELPSDQGSMPGTDFVNISYIWIP